MNDKFNQSINVVGEVTFADDLEKGTQYILDEFKAKIETSEREAMAAEIRRETEIRREQKAQQSKAQE
ncbi:MAG: hypothetical protein HFE62_04590, partial [Firmicutes bacterium]|nr:hypothetical protein [Bacillota bacterium]